MSLAFTKMHGLGNDFVVLDGISQVVALSPESIRQLADRHFGIGCDQVLVVEEAPEAGVDFRYRIFNADGGEVEQCGNGARCFARFVRDKGLTEKTDIVVATAAGIIRPRVQPDGRVTVDMGAPRFAPRDVPFVAESEALTYALTLDSGMVNIGAVSMGNPHAVLRVDRVETAPVFEIGPAIQRDERFPRGVNVGFMEVVGRDHVRLRVFERGVGETLACGSGACAAVCIGRRWGLLNRRVRVELLGGELLIRWPGDDASVEMTGPVATVFEGEIEI